MSMENIDAIYKEYKSKNWINDDAIIYVRLGFYDGMWELIKILNEHPELKNKIKEELQLRRMIAGILC